jgi:SAM-dependent MidA family methyltransferase
VLEAADGDLGRALRYVMVEPRALPRARQQESLRDPRVLWASSIAEVAVEAGCVFANEVLDNQPVHLVKKDRQEVYVVVSEGELELVDGSVSSPALPAYLEELDLPAGTAMQVSPDTVTLLNQAASSIERGALFFVDYGYEADEIAERGGNTVATYSPSGAASDPLDAPGEMDITAHVDWTAVRKALQEGLRTLGPLPQSDVLRALGLRTIDGRLRAQHQEALAAGDGPGAIRILSRRNALGTLTNPGGLGGLGVMVATKGLEAGPEELLPIP